MVMNSPLLGGHQSTARGTVGAERRGRVPLLMNDPVLGDSSPLLGARGAARRGRVPVLMNGALLGASGPLFGARGALRRGRVPLLRNRRWAGGCPRRQQPKSRFPLPRAAKGRNDSATGSARFHHFSFLAPSSAPSQHPLRFTSQLGGVSMVKNIERRPNRAQGARTHARSAFK